MAIILVSSGKAQAVVSDEDFAALNAFTWHLVGGRLKRFYAGRRDADGKTIYMHRVVLNAPDGVQVDHINNDRLDNRRENLRLCNQSQNNANSSRRRTSTNTYRGVYWDRYNRSWRAWINVGGKGRSLGYFKNEIDAAIAYNKAALDAFGEFAVPNQIESEGRK